MSFNEKYLKYKNKYLELKKQMGGQPSNPTEVDITVKKFIEEWNKQKTHWGRLEPRSYFIINNIIENLKPTENLLSSYNHIFLVVHGEISLLKKSISKTNAMSKEFIEEFKLKKEIEEETNHLKEYEKLLAILE